MGTCKMLLHGGENQNEDSESDISKNIQPAGHRNGTINRSHIGQTPHNFEGRALSALSRFGQNARRVSKPAGFNISMQYWNLQLNMRKILWALYLMRDPFFCKYTRQGQRLESTDKLLQPIPVIGFLAAKLIDLMVGAQTRYTYMSGS